MRQLMTGAAAVAIMTSHVLLAQTPMKPTAPGSGGDPAWQGVLRMSDGRTFVTDGGLAIDAALAKPAKLPEREVPSKILENYLNAAHQHEYGFSDLSVAESGRTFSAPGGILLSATYVNYLRRVLPSGSTRFHMTAQLQPIVVRVGGKPVCVLMAVAK